MEMIGKATVPGAFLVDLMPSREASSPVHREFSLTWHLPVKYLPAWIPFNHIHDTAASGRAEIEGLVTRPYEHVKREREQGTNQPSFTAECLDKYQSDDPDAQASIEHTLRWAAGSMYGGEYQPVYARVRLLIVVIKQPEARLYV